MNIQIDEQTHKKILQGLRNLNEDCCLRDWEKTAAYWDLVLSCDPNPYSAKVGDILTLVVDCWVSCKDQNKKTNITNKPYDYEQF